MLAYEAQQYSYAMSSSSKVAVLFSCQNPFCVNFNKKAFATQAAYTQHIDRSIGCYNFIVNQRHVAAPHGASVARRPRPREDGDATWTSNKRPSLLRRNVVNDVTAAENVPVVTLPQFPNVHFVGSDRLQHSSGDDYAAAEDDDFVDVDGADDSSVLGDNHSIVNCPTTGTGIDENDGPSFRSNFMYTTDQKWTVSLLKILDHANAPDYAFGEVLEWARGACADNYSFKPVGGLSRSKNVDALINSVVNGDKLLPFVRRVELDHGPPSDVICFDFVPQLLSLLQNRSIMTAENLVIDINEPLKPYYELKGSNVLGEALSGSVYCDAYKRLITDPTRNQLFVPIIQWIDRTSVTGNDRFSLKPYMFTPAIFTEKFRRSIKAWGYHGFLPKKKSSSAQKQTLGMGDSIRNYHKELDGALESFRKSSAQLRDVYLPIGPKGRIKVDIVTCVLFIIQDMQEGDMLCGRYGVHTSGIQRSHRSCDVNHENLKNSDAGCRYLIASDMDVIAQHETDDATRKRWSQHKLDNAFNHIVFADAERGIFGATPVETMHAFRKGVIEKVTKLVLESLPASKKAAFDDLAIAFHKSHRQTHRKKYPSTDFNNGVTNLTKITATERVGIVFLFVILFQYESGWQMIQACLEKRSNTKVPEVLEVLESLLCFDAWLNQSHFWETSDPRHVAKVMKRHQDSIRNFMDMCKKSIPLKVEGKEDNKKKGRKEKKGQKERCEASISMKKEGEPNDPEAAWKFPKFHELLHIVDDMSRFGSPVNFCAQRPESLLIPAAKHPGRRAQKRIEGSAYELQSAQRLMYSFMIDTIHTRIWDEPDYDSDAAPPGRKGVAGITEDHDVYQGTGQASFGCITRTKVGRRYHYDIDWGKTKTHQDFLHLPGALVEFVCASFKEVNKIRFCTEYKRDVHTFRCHPSYQSDGCIYDWMVIDFGEVLGKFPCRLSLVVVVDSPTEFDEKYQLVVQSTTEEVKEHESTLLREWKWSPTYHVVSANSVVAPCFVISISHDTSTVLETKPYEEWASMFT